MSSRTDVPYCGVPPVPGDLWQNWNLDPFLIAALVALAAGYAMGVHRYGNDLDLEAWRRRCFAAGWVVLVAMLVSPICNLTVALFSARVGQHMALTLVAAPLLMLGRPQAILLAVCPRIASFTQRIAAMSPISGAATGALSFAVLLWLWHMPAPYEATLASHGIYWLMHVSLFGSALVLWAALLDLQARARLRGCLVALGTSMQMGFLGAVLAFSVRPFFESHAATTLAWGLAPIQDQQLGGLIMWVPGGLVFLIASTALLASLLRSLEAEGAVH